MKIRFMLLTLIALLFLGCGDDESESTNSTKQTNDTSAVKLVYDPENSIMPMPNDLMLLRSADGTLAMPDEQASDNTNPIAAMGSVDGWSAVSPIVIDVSSENTSVSQLAVLASSAEQINAVRLFEVTLGGYLSNDTECIGEPLLTGCKIGRELNLGVDFKVDVNNEKVTISPLKPLMSNRSYLYVLTNLITDTEGNPLAPSVSYASFKKDVSLQPLDTQKKQLIQKIINSYESLLETKGLNKDDIILSAAFSTQDTDIIHKSLKELMVSPSNTNKARYLTQPAAMTDTSGMLVTLAQFAQFQPSDGALFDKANVGDVYRGVLELVSYGKCNTNGCIKLDSSGQPILVNGVPVFTVNERWQASGDSPLSVLSALASGALSQTEFERQAIAHGLSPNQALSAPESMLDKTWQLDDGTPVDKTRHLTRYNPVPAPTIPDVAPVLFAIPDASRLSTYLGTSINKPTEGWPAVILLHGLGGNKEIMTTYAGEYLSKGIAVIAIDMPLHGERSFDFNGDGIYEITATVPMLGNEYINGNPLNFINILSIPTTRDNFRQAIADVLALRNIISEESVEDSSGVKLIDPNNISMQGLSLGAITATMVTALANLDVFTGGATPLSPNPFAIKGVSLTAPAGGLAAAIAKSDSYGPLITNGITQTDAFIEQVNEANTEGFAVGSAGYKVLVLQVLNEFLPQFINIAQTIIDSVDPINHAATITAKGTPIHLIEIVGDGINNKADQVLPNEVADYPLSGTEPLISALSLPCVDATVAGSGAVRFTKGHHASLVDVSESLGVTSGDAARASAEMQSQVSYFAETLARDAAEIIVTDTSLLKACL